MDEFINSVTEKLGISSENASSATGSVLNMVKQAVPENDFSALMGKLPGADKLVEAAGSAEPEQSGGGMLGSVSKMASGLLGGDGGGLDVLGSLSSFGLGGDKATSFVTMLIDFIKGKAGGEFVDGILAKVPLLKTVVG